jgi:hypothetical protein
VSSSSDELAAGEKRILNIIGRNPHRAYTAHDFLPHGKGEIEQTMAESKAVLRRLDRLVELGLLKKQVVYTLPSMTPAAVRFPEPEASHDDAGNGSDAAVKDNERQDSMKHTVRPRLELCPLCGSRLQSPDHAQHAADG